MLVKVAVNRKRLRVVTDSVYNRLECTSDQHFVFAIRSDSGPIKIDPMQLVVPGSQCKPVIVNEQVAIFKFKVSDCGTRFYVSESFIFQSLFVRALNPSLI